MVMVKKQTFSFFFFFFFRKLTILEFMKEFGFAWL